MNKSNKYPNEIPLTSRYSDVQNKLVRLEGNIYKLVTSGHYVRAMFDYHPDKITAIDPEGGPMIGIGDAITKNLCVNEIWHSKEKQGYLIELI